MTDQEDRQRQNLNSPLFADSGELKKTRRMSGQKIITFALVVACVVILFVFMAINSERTIQERAVRERAPSMSDSSRLQDDLIAAAERLKNRQQPQIPPQPGISTTEIYEGSSQVVIIAPPTAQKKRQRKLTDSEKAMGKRYGVMKQESLMSKSELSGFGDSALSSPSASSAAALRAEAARREAAASGSAASGSAALQGAEPAMSAADMRAIIGDVAQGGDINAQDRKIDFLVRAGAERTAQDYSTAIRTAPLAPMEIKAGTVIPGILLVGVNSDLPGAVIGQVSEHVWDTATGRFLLIPQGTRIVGVYDSRVTYGQKRVSVVWNRLIYPDGSSLNIAGSPGTDMAGYSGMKGKVDNHYGQLLMAALFTSVFTAAVEIAGDNDSRNYNDNKSPAEVLAETTATTIANIGARMAERALSIQPTIVVKPGSRFNVLVLQDVVFPRTWSGKETRVVGF